MAMEEWDEEALANYRGTEYIGKLGLEQSYEDDLHGVTGYEEVETSAGGRAVRRLDSHGRRRATRCTCRSTSSCRRWSRRCSASAAARWWRSTRATARCWPSSASRPSTPTCSSMASTPRTGASSTSRSTSRCSTARCAAPTRRARPSSPSWRMAALTPASARPSTIIIDTGTFSFGGHRSAATETDRAGPMDMARPSSSRATSTTTSLANELGVDLMHEQLEPFGLRPQDRHRHRGRSHRRAALDRVEAQGSTAARTAEVVCRRNHLAGHRPGLQQLHDAADGQRHRPRWPPAASASSRAWCARSRTWSRTSGGAWPTTRSTPLPLKPEHVEVILRAMNGVTQEGTSVRVVRRRALQERRQDRHGAGGRHQGRTRSTTPPRSRSTSATMRCTSPSRRSRRRRSRWR